MYLTTQCFCSLKSIGILIRSYLNDVYLRQIKVATLGFCNKICAETENKNKNVSKARSKKLRNKRSSHIIIYHFTHTSYMLSCSWKDKQLCSSNFSTSSQYKIRLQIYPTLFVLEPTIQYKTRFLFGNSFRSHKISSLEVWEPLEFLTQANSSTITQGFFTKSFDIH